MHARSLLAASLAPSLGAACARADDWMQFGYDSIHCGNGNGETIPNRHNAPTLVVRHGMPLTATNGRNVDGGVNLRRLAVP